MRIICFDHFSEENFVPAQFGGHDAKFYAFFDNCNWMIKRAHNSIIDRERLKNKKLPTYDSSCQSEWLGSKIYEMLDIPVQKTIYGKYQGKDVIACSYIYDDKTERLIEMRSMFQTMSPQDQESLRYSPGDSKVLLLDVFKFIQHDKRFDNFRESVVNRFWDMFVVDAFIGNNDRHMGNWGIILNRELKHYCLAPVYDNGSAFRSRWNEKQFERCAKSTPGEIKQIIVGGCSPYVIGEKRINSLKYMLNNPCYECIEAMFDIIPQIDLKEGFYYIDQLHKSNIISGARNIALKKILTSTLDDFLFPALKKIEKRIDNGEKFKTMQEIIEEDQEKIDERPRM